jgi:hypothetical protein
MTASILFRVEVRLSLATGGGSIYVNLLPINMIVRHRCMIALVTRLMLRSALS